MRRQLSGEQHAVFLNSIHEKVNSEGMDYTGRNFRR
jgi:hypothetical protein